MIKIANLEKRMGTASGTLLFTCSTLLIKIIGAIYKIPLYNLLGNSGIGIYQIVFPVYALLLTLSGGGIPAGMTKIVSNGYNAKSVLKKCLTLFCPVGAIFSFALFFLGDTIALFQGNYLAGSLYKVISPSVFTVCIIGCIRGYFQGQSNFIPSAFSQIIEQVVKAVSGVIALLLVKGNYVIKAFWACLAITFSEIVAFIFLVFYYLLKSRKSNNLTQTVLLDKSLTYKEILHVIMPLTLSSLCLPLASFLDTFIAVNALKNTFGSQATAVFGVYTGGVDVVIALPVALLHSFTLGFLPKMGAQENFSKTLFYNFLISLFFTLAIIIFAPLGARILFGSQNAYLTLLITLLRFASLNVIIHSCLHAVTFFMLSIDKQKLSLLFLFIGVFVKMILSVTLIKIPKINVFGMIISDAGCYLVALILNLIYIKYIKKIKLMGNKNENNFGRPRRRSKFTFGKSA